MRGRRVPIWSVLEEDQRWYSWLFPSLWLAGILYHAYLRFRIGAVSPEEPHILLTVGEFTKDLGIVGLSAAIVALMVIAGRRLTLALFDWGNRGKTLRQGIEQGRTEGRTEERDDWMAWYRRQQDAYARNEEFNEPPPGVNAKESQAV